MILIILILFIIAGIILKKIGFSLKNIILASLIIGIIFTGIYGIYYYTNKYVSPNWKMKIMVDGNIEGYECVVYIYSNRSMIVEPNFSFGYSKKQKIDKNINLEEIYEYIEQYKSNSEQTEDEISDIKYCIELDNGVTKNISIKDIELKPFFEEIPLSVFAMMKNK